MGKGDKIRAFLACELSAEVREQILDWLKRMQERIGGVRWVGPDQLHLTLRFLGEVTPATLEVVADRAKQVADRSGQGELQVLGTGLFASLRRPRVLWMGISGDLERLSTLNQDLNETLHGLDIHYEHVERSFHPHITVGRIRNPKKTSGLEQWLMAGKDKDFGKFPLEALTLIKSELTSQGARYTTLASYTLGG